jgi:hypothetical protein
MVFREVICTVVATGLPEKVELSLTNSVPKPEVTHVKGFGALKANSGVKNAMRSGVVGFQRSASAGLRMSHFLEGSDNGDGCLRIEEESACFSL